MSENTEHPFLKKLIEDKFWYYRNTVTSADQQYCDNVYNAFSQIKELLENLQTPRILLHELFAEKKSSIDRGKLNRYHIENYFLRITTYKDLMIHFIGIVKDWALDKNNSAHRKLVKQAKAAEDIQVIDFLAGLDVLLFKAIDIRNKIAHQGNNEDTDTILLNLYDDVKTFVNELPLHINVNDLQLPDEEMMDTFHGLATAKSLIEMQDNEQAMLTNFKSALDLLYSVYLQKIPDVHPINS